MLLSDSFSSWCSLWSSGAAQMWRYPSFDLIRHNWSKRMFFLDLALICLIFIHGHPVSSERAEGQVQLFKFTLKPSNCSNTAVPFEAPLRLCRIVLKGNILTHIKDPASCLYVLIFLLFCCILEFLGCNFWAIHCEAPPANNSTSWGQDLSEWKLTVPTALKLLRSLSVSISSG